jgi:hypothetical protein
MMRTLHELVFLVWTNWVTGSQRVILTEYRKHFDGSNVSAKPADLQLNIWIYFYTGRFIMFSVITYICNKKPKGPTLMELFTAIRGAHIEHL